MQPAIIDVDSESLPISAVAGRIFIVKLFTYVVIYLINLFILSDILSLYYLPRFCFILKLVLAPALALVLVPVSCYCFVFILLFLLYLLLDADPFANDPVFNRPVESPPRRGGRGGTTRGGRGVGRGKKRTGGGANETSVSSGIIFKGGRRIIIGFSVPFYNFINEGTNEDWGY